jgi:uncharacterized membrane protein YhaH (DUF805 family)
MRHKFWVWLLALIPILAVIGLGAGALATKLGSASLLITLPVVAVVGVVFGKAMARSVFGRRQPPQPPSWPPQPPRPPG